MFDAIIIGKGPAGISASLYTVRAGLKTLVIGVNGSNLKKAEKVENYFGFSDVIRGEDLLREGEKQALRLGVEIVEEEVLSLNKPDLFEVSTSTGKYQAKAVILATGQPQKKLDIVNLAKFEGIGVSYCTTCDGFFFKNKKVGILGFKDYAIHEAIEMQVFTKDITIFTDGNELDLTAAFLQQAMKFKIDKRPIARLGGDESLKTVHFRDETLEVIEGMFVAYDTAASVDFAKKMGVFTENNAILVDKNQQTNIIGLFAAGDCTGGFKQIATAVGQGALAGRRVIEYVRNL